MELKLNNVSACYFAFIAAALYALSSPISKLLLNKVPAAAMAGFLYLGAGVGLTVIRVIQKNSKKEDVEKDLTQNDLPYIIGMVILDIAAPIFLMYGLKFATAANVSLLNNFEIVATSVIACVFFKEKISNRLWKGIIFVTIASIVLSIEGSESFKFSAGSLLVIGACVCWGLENNCTKELSNKNPIEIVQIKGFFSGCGSIIISLIIGERLTTDMSIFIFYAVVLGFFSYGLSIMFYIYAQRKLGAAKTSSYYASSPFIGAVLSFIIFKSIPSQLFVIALIIMIIGTYYTVTDSEEHNHNKFHSHDGVYSIDYYSYLSKIRNWNPSYKVVLAFSALLFCIIADNIIVSITIILTMGFITVYMGGLKMHQYLSLLKIPVAFMIMGSIAIVLGFSFSPVGQYNLNLCWFYIYTSDESILQTINLILKAFGAVSAMYMMTLSTPTSEIISVLRKLHIPKIIIELMNMIYRFIFIIMDVQCKMKNSVQSRLGYIDFKTACYSFGSTAGNLLIVSLKKANSYYDAMESRCYDGEMLFLEEEKPIYNRQIIYFVIYFIMLISMWIIVK